MKIQKAVELCTEKFLDLRIINSLKSSKIAIGEVDGDGVAFEYDDGKYIIGICCLGDTLYYTAIDHFTKRTVVKELFSDMTRIVEHIYDVKADSNDKGVMNTFAYALFALQIVSANLSLTILDCDPGDRIVIMREAFVKMLATAKQHAYWKCDTVIPISTNFFQNKEVKPQSGSFQLFSTDFNWSSVGVKPTDIEGLKKKYSLFKDREFTEEEKTMLESNQTGDYYKPSENVINMVKKVAKSWERDPRLRKRIFFLKAQLELEKHKTARCLQTSLVCLTQRLLVFPIWIALMLLVRYTLFLRIGNITQKQILSLIQRVFLKSLLVSLEQTQRQKMSIRFWKAMELSMYTTLLRSLRRLRMVGCLKFKSLLVSLMLLFCLCLTRHLKVMAFLICQIERSRGIQTSFV